MRWRLPIIFFFSPIAFADQSGHVHTVRMMMINMTMMRVMMMMMMMMRLMIFIMIMIMTTQVAHSSESSVYTVAQPHETQGVYTPDLTQVSKLALEKIA